MKKLLNFKTTYCTGYTFSTRKLLCKFFPTLVEVFALSLNIFLKHSYFFLLTSDMVSGGGVVKILNRNHTFEEMRYVSHVILCYEYPT